MTDNLRDAIRDAMPGDKQFAEKLAAAIRAEVDLRVNGLSNAVSDAEPESRAFYGRDSLLQALALIESVPYADYCRARRDLRDGRQDGCTPFEVEAPRRNPYADWATGGNRFLAFTYQDILKARYVAWNAGAQIAEKRDE